MQISYFEKMDVTRYYGDLIMPPSPVYIGYCFANVCRSVDRNRCPLLILGSQGQGHRGHL